jgi:hypothetical protein
MKSHTLNKRRHHGKGCMKPFSETAVIYCSPEDGCWIAHSLRTDQIGTGLDMGRALAALIRGIDSILEIAAEDETVAYLREAPREIQKMAKECKPLPNEIYEVAHKLARGQWPSDIEPLFQAANDDEKFSLKLTELNAA